MPFIEEINHPNSQAKSAAKAAILAKQSLSNMEQDNEAPLSTPSLVSSTMLWGLRIDQNSICFHVVDNPFTVTMATLAPVSNENSKKGSDKTTLYVGDSPENLFALCTLSSKQEKYQQQLNLFFTEGSKVVFKLVGGTTPVDLTGVYNLIEENEEVGGCHGECDDEHCHAGEEYDEEYSDSDEENFTDSSFEDDSEYESEENIDPNGIEGTTKDIVIGVGKLNDLGSDSEDDNAMEEEIQDGLVVEEGSDIDEKEAVEGEVEDPASDEDSDEDVFAHMDFDDEEDDEDVDTNNDIDWDQLLKDEAENEANDDDLPIGMGSIFALADDYDLQDTEDLDDDAIEFNFDELDDLEEPTKSKKNNSKKGKNKGPKIEEIEEKDIEKLTITKKTKVLHPSKVEENVELEETITDEIIHAKKILKKPGAKSNKKRRVVFNEKVKVGVFQKPMKKKSQKFRR